MQYRHSALYASRRSPVMARNVVSTSQPLAAAAGLSMLRRGGNAVDAAIAAAIALTVVEPTGNGIGSDAFAILWDGKQLHGLNASGRSPKGWTPERFAAVREMPFRGWESVTVPGAVSAWCELSEKFGRLDFADLFEPAIGYAREGYLVSPIIGTQWGIDARELRGQPGFADHFMPDGSAPAVGSVFRSPDMARTLGLIARTRGEAFYRGELAEKIVAFSQSHGGVLSLDDMADHDCFWSGTIAQDFGDVTLNEIPPNGQGIAALMALGILEHLGVERYEVDSVEALHLQIEAMKLAFRDMRAYVADADHMTAPSAGDLLDADYLKERAALVDPDRATDFKAGAPKHGGTVYLTAADDSGMMVSFIQSNYAGFGSGVVVPETGIAMQNRGNGFSLEKGHQNEVGPAKRPFQTIIPGFLTKNGQPLASFGVMGGPIQAQGHVQMTLRTQLWGQDPQTAVDAPRWRAVSGLDVMLERAFGKAVFEGLAAKGHRLSSEPDDASFGFGGAQFVQKIEGGYVAGSDPRKDGGAVGF